MWVNSKGFGVISVILRVFFHEVNVQNGDIYLGSLKLHNFIWGGGGGMPDILDILFSVNSKCRVHAYV